eukprot:CAMPEP_0184655768 /NCGR_PEP_ID=MMETSP0308-20130426/14409_1 /TAXON_ID=38269 /ORGANISM="Gloeochaete witrockiana, Strain SAG 46.84" /LENGTH=471 /DNA_ID=CAMNT_0027092503 /DNA_START=460 /DNA_END=1875 /DNA_ORIENTATION=+
MRRTKPLNFDTNHLDFKNRQQLGQGGFGVVYRGQVLQGPEEGLEVVVKCLNNEPRTFQQGDVELYANTKLMQQECEHIAPFVGYHKSSSKFWLVWEFEGETTLDAILHKKDWLNVMETKLFGRLHTHLDEPARKVEVMKSFMTQMFKGLSYIHGHQMVHRDIKPSNIVITDEDMKVKLIDLGCATDLSTNVGYIAKEAPGTREYLPPEWRVRLDQPAAFDMFASGMIMLQIAFPHLRSIDMLDKFRAELRTLGGDLDKWLQRKLKSHNLDKKYTEGLECLNLDGGAGWDFLRALMQNDPAKRLTAGRALAEHKFLRPAGPYRNGSVADVRRSEEVKTEVLMMDVEEHITRRRQDNVERRKEHATSVEVPMPEQIGSRPGHKTASFNSYLRGLDEKWWSKGNQAQPVPMPMPEQQSSGPFRKFPTPRADGVSRSAIAGAPRRINPGAAVGARKMPSQMQMALRNRKESPTLA